MAQQEKTAAKVGAYTTLLGSACMLAGAAIWAASGANIDQSLYDNDMAGYLEQALAAQNLLIINLSLWIIGVILLGLGATMMAMLSGKGSLWAQIVQYNYWIAVPLVVASYMAWLAVIVRLGPSASQDAATIAGALGWFAVRADWVGTVLVIGTGPVLITAAGRGIWAPNWLRIWSYFALAAGILNIIAQFSGGLASYGFLIIPLGMSWMIAAGIVMLRLRLWPA